MRSTRPLLLLTLAAATLATTPADAQRRQRGGGDRSPLEQLAKADANGDGITTREEFRTARAARFKQMDRNGDGAVSRDDFGRLIKFRPEIGQRLDTMLAEADANHDGRLSQDEMAKAPMPLFDRADANGDDRVDRAELADARARAQQLRDQASR
jgi:hypothetical protein